MRVRGGDAARALVASLILASLAFVILVQYAPDSVAFSPNNYGWNGMEQVATTYKVNFTTSLSSVPSDAVLLVAQPSVNFSSAEAASVKAFLGGGGTLLVADRSGVANSLLEKLGAAISIESKYTISDSTYNWKSAAEPTALVIPGAKSEYSFLDNVTGVALNNPSPLQLGVGAVELAVTSQFSTASTPGGQALQGPFAVAAAQKLDGGTLVVVGGSQFLLNSGWKLADNRVLIRNLLANTEVYIDASHWGISSIALMKGELREVYSFLATSPTRYLATLIFVGVALALVPSREGSPRASAFNRGEGGSGE